MQTFWNTDNGGKKWQSSDCLKLSRTDLVLPLSPRIEYTLYLRLNKAGDSAETRILNAQYSILNAQFNT